MQGLYLISNDDPLPILLAKISAALATGQVSLLQYRRKKIAKSEQHHEIAKILAICDKYAVPLVINDDVAQAKQFNCHLHLGQTDGSLVDARAVLGPQAIIGRTCLSSLSLAQQAIAEGASYIAFGAIYGSQTKPESAQSGLEIVRQAASQFSTPICAIGGLTVDNSQAVLDAGAKLCAVVSDILALSVEEIPKRIEAWAHLFQYN